MIYRAMGSLLIAFALLLFASPSSASPQGSGRSPEAVVDKTEHDFGEVFAGEEVWHTFTIHNAGNAPLELAERKASAPPAAAAVFYGKRIAAAFAPARAASRPASPG